MGKTNKNKGFSDDESSRNEDSFVKDSDAPAVNNEKFLDLKIEIEKKVEGLASQLDSEQMALHELSEKLSKNFSEDFSRLQGELQVLLLNLSDLNTSKESEQVERQIEDFNRQFSDLKSRLNELTEKISSAVDSVEEDESKITEETPSANREDAVKEDVVEKPQDESGFVIKGDALIAPGISLNLPSAIKSGAASISQDADGWYVIKGKIGNKDVQAKINLADGGNSVRIHTPGSAGSFSLKTAQSALDRIFGEHKQYQQKPEKPKVEVKQKTGAEEKKVENLPEEERGKEAVTKDAKKTEETAEAKEEMNISQERLQKIVDYLEDVVSDGNVDSNYQKWMDILRTQLPETEGESEQMQAKRKLVDEKIFQDNLKKVTEHLKLIHGQKVADDMINIKKGEEQAKWEKRKRILDELYGDAIRSSEDKILPPEPNASVVSEASIEAPENLSSGQEGNFQDEERDLKASESLSDEFSTNIEQATEEAIALEISPEETKADISFDTESVEEIRDQNERIEKLTAKLIETRQKLTEVFIKKEKSAGVIGRFKKMFTKGEARGAEDEAFESAWQDYAFIQTELIEANKMQAEHLRSFLGDQSKILQEKIGSYYKGKENVVSKVWRRMGDMNLYNYLDKKGQEVAKKDAENISVNIWDRFWSNRAKELKGSNMLFKLGAKALSVRLGLSLGLMSAGVFGVAGAAEARGLMVGVGTAFGSRHMEDALQNKLQNRFGNCGDFYGSSKEAEVALREKYFVAGLQGETADQPEDKKIEKRRKKMEKELGLAEKILTEFESLPIEQRMAKIQEKISAIEAFSYVNGVNLSKDNNYQRLISARDRITSEYLALKAIENGDDRAIVRPNDITDALAFLDSRKIELARTAEKISSEKIVRWGKRLVATAAGVASGTYAYFATLSRAEIFSGQKIETNEFVAGNEPMPSSGQSETFPQETMATTETGASYGEEMVRGATPEELAKINKFSEVAGENQTAIKEFGDYMDAGHSPENISNAFLVHKGDGIERVLQRQLLLDPKGHGFTGNLEDADIVRKWAGHEASVIAQKQGLADKYFIYDAKNPQYLVLHKDGNVDVLSHGRLHHVSEIEAARAREMAEQMADMAKTQEGEAVPVREVIDLKTGQPDIFTDAEQAQYQILVNKGNYDDAMDLMLKCKARGPIYEMPDGTEIHRADIAEWEGDTPKIKVSSGAEISYDYLASDNLFIADSPSHDHSLVFKTIAVTESGDPVMAPAYEFDTEYAETKDFVEALGQSHPGSPEYRALINSLKDKFSHLELLGKDPSDYFGKELVAKVNQSGDYLREAARPTAQEVSSGDVFSSQPLETTGQPTAGVESSDKPLSEMDYDEIMEAAQNRMDQINNGFSGFNSKDAPLASRIESLRGVLEPGEAFEHNSVKYTLVGNEIRYDIQGVRGVVDSVKKANLLAEFDNLLRNKSAEIALADGPARQEMYQIMSELDKLNKFNPVNENVEIPEVLESAENLAEAKDASQFSDRWTEIKFVYDQDHKVIGFKSHSQAGLGTVPAKSNLCANASFQANVYHDNGEMLLESVGFHDNAYREMVAAGLGNTEEAKFLMRANAKELRDLSKAFNKPVAELYNAETIRMYQL